MPRIQFNRSGNDNRQNAITAERVELLYSQASIAIGATAVLALVVGFLVSGQVNSVALAVWIGYLLLVSAFRWKLYSAFKRRKPAHTLRYADLFVFGALLSGIGWGFVTVLILPFVSVEYQILSPSLSAA